MRREDLLSRIRAIPFTERTAMLVCSIVEQDHQAFAAVAGLVRLITTMSRGLNVQKRYALAERLRSAADQLEQSHELAQ